MAWYEEPHKKIDDDTASIAIGRYQGSRTAREENPRSFVMGLTFLGAVGMKYLEKLDRGHPDVYGVRFYRAIILRKRSNGDGSMADVEFEVLIGVGVDKSMRDVPGTYFTANKVEWK